MTTRRRDGKVFEERAHLDMLGVLQQIGAVSGAWTKKRSPLVAKLGPEVDGVEDTRVEPDVTTEMRSEHGCT